MAGLCKVMIIGNLGKDPELRYTPAGKPVTTFNVAVNRLATGADGERREETEWFQVVTFSKLAERCDQQLTKGQRVYVEGKLQTRTWAGPDGQARKVLEVVATDVIFLGQRRPPLSSGEFPSGDDADADESDY
ncbi:MAG: single-stranded DNA-binding protein [Chloroflexota bacterium]|nr:single-stranded DNA-binding protein [Dehalococcoidia bacterium]MDW8253950.1 single-stranded DNA-binding protein [Chloroflexota bacterium]